jgi:hypothetical protein
MTAQTEWAFALWKDRPAIWSEVAAFSFERGEWRSVNSGEVGTEGRPRTKASLETEFGRLPEAPPFPLEEVATAFRLEEKRLRRM